ALDVAGALRAAQELHLKSRQASLGVGLFRDARRGAFYSAFLSALGKDEVEASVLHLNGRPVAYCLYLCYSGTRLLLGTQYDLEYARFSPGAVLFYLDVQYWFAQPGGIVLDLARGRFSWKRQWTSSVRRN